MAATRYGRRRARPQPQTRPIADALRSWIYDLHRGEIEPQRAHDFAADVLTREPDNELAKLLDKNARAKGASADVSVETSESCPLSRS